MFFGLSLSFSVDGTAAAAAAPSPCLMYCCSKRKVPCPPEDLLKTLPSASGALAAVAIEAVVKCFAIHSDPFLVAVVLLNYSFHCHSVLLASPNRIFSAFCRPFEIFLGNLLRIRCDVPFLFDEDGIPTIHLHVLSAFRSGLCEAFEATNRFSLGIAPHLARIDLLCQLCGGGLHLTELLRGVEHEWEFVNEVLSGFDATDLDIVVKVNPPRPLGSVLIAVVAGATLMLL